MKSWLIHRSVLLAFALFFQTEGMLFINMIQQFMVGVEMRQKVESDDSQFQVISLSLQLYKQSKINQHEISVGGEMYDIKSVDICGDTANLLVLRDHKEEHLLKRIREYFRSDKPGKKRNPVWFYQLFSLKYIAPVQSTILLAALSSKNSFSYISVTRNISVAEFPGPPPKLI